MKIGYFADGPWSHKAIELIFETPELEIAFIVPRYDTQDPVLKDWSVKLEVPYLPHANVNSKEFIDDIKNYDADIFVSMSFNQILKTEIINLPPLGFINCHAGALPFYRGRNPLNWVLINGEDSFGITVHKVDEGIDTGDIVVQKHYPISQEDNYGTLLKFAISECAVLLHSALVKIKNGAIQLIKQQDIHPVGTYFGMRTFGDEFVDFSWGAKRFFNFVRAITNPGPYARCFIGDQEFAIAASKLIVGAPTYIATEGEVVGKSVDGNIVKIGDSTILLTSMSEVNEGVVGDFFTPRFRIGTRFNAKK